MEPVHLYMVDSDATCRIVTEVQFEENEQEKKERFIAGVRPQELATAIDTCFPERVILDGHYALNGLYKFSIRRKSLPPGHLSSAPPPGHSIETVQTNPRYLGEARRNF